MNVCHFDHIHTGVLSPRGPFLHLLDVCFRDDVLLAKNSIGVCDEMLICGTGYCSNLVRRNCTVAEDCVYDCVI